MQTSSWKQRTKKTYLNHRDAPQLHFTNPRMLNMEEYEGMVLMKIIIARYHQLVESHHKTSIQDQHQHQNQQRVQQLNISDPTHNRGKINRVNSFNTAQEWVNAEAKMSKGGPFKSSGTKGHPQPSGSNQVESCRPQLNCTACGGHDHLRKDCHEDVFAIDAEPDLMLQRCAESQTQPATGNTICIYCGSVNHTSGKCRNKPNDNRERAKVNTKRP